MAIGEAGQRLRLDGARLIDLPTELAAMGVDLEVSPAFADRRVELDGHETSVEQALEAIALSVGGELVRVGTAYRLVPRLEASASPLPSTADQVEPRLLGALPKEDILRVLRTHQADIRFCYEKALDRGREIEGNLQVHFVIAASGSVSAAGIDTEHSTLEDAEVWACVVDVLRNMVFAQPTGGGVVEVTYLYAFSSR